MTVVTRQFEQFNNNQPQYPVLTSGIVVDTNDPQNAGRVRVMCTKLGDTSQTPIDDIPWAVNASAIMGVISVGTRGPEFDTINGPTAYGLWNVPKVGARLTVGCIDNDPRYRVFIGGGAQQHLMHTAPHGRWFAGDGVGPVSSTEQQIQPLARNMDAAFGAGPSAQKLTRAADYSAARVDVSQLGASISQRPDDFQLVGPNGWVTTNGYQISRQDPTAPTAITDRNYDNQVTHLTSAGFHSLSMDDRQENCRMRLRTSAGHQIIMDDTNERIYISTARGENWIEMDQIGNIDIFSSGKISIHSDGDLNLSSKQNVNIMGEIINMKGNAGVNLAGPDYNVAADTIKMQSSGAVHIEGGTFHALSHGAGYFTADGMHLHGGGSITETAGIIHQNGPAAAQASPAGAVIASVVSRMPQHEPWIRSSNLDGKKFDPQFKDPNDPNIGKLDGTTRYNRNPFWRP